MEKEPNIRNEMYKYTAKGNTLYDLLDEYLELDDFSTRSIINFLRRNLNLQIETANKKDFLFLTNTYKSSISEQLVDSMLKNMSQEEQQNLLERFQSVNPEKYNFPYLMGYINFLEDANFTKTALEAPSSETESPVLNQDVERLNQILIETATDKASPEMVSALRNALMRGILIRYAIKQVKKENDGKDFLENPKFQKLQLFYKVFSDNNLVEEYDNALSYSKHREEEAIKAANLRTNCKLARLLALAELTGKPMLEVLDTVDSPDKSLTDLISQEHKSSELAYIPRGGDYKWSFRQHSKPRIILNESVEFSENGEENQTLFVTSLGNFKYGNNMGKFSYEDPLMDMLGVTILGGDRNVNYFVITPSNNIGNIVNGVDSEYYKKVLLSEFVLDDTIGFKDRFLPEIGIDENGNALLDYDRELSLMGMKPANAIKYATHFKGEINGGRQHPATLQQLCNSQELFELQMELLSNYRSRETYRGEH